MDSSVKMMEIETENSLKESTQTMRANGEVNGSCDDGSMDTCSSPTSSQQPHDSEKSNDSSRFTDIQKVPTTSEVPANNNDEQTDEPMQVDENKDNQRLDEDGADNEEEDEDVDNENEDDDEHTGDTERSERQQNSDSRPTNASAQSVADSIEEHDLANGTEEDDVEDAISVDSGSSDEDDKVIESVNIGDTNSEDEDSDHSEPIELNESDGEHTNRNGNSKDNRERKVKSTDSGDVTIVENENSGKSNGEVCSSPEVQEICDLSKDKDSSSETTPKKKKKSGSPPAKPESITPRRSSRNLNKQKSYIEPRENDIVDDVDDDEDEIEEITPDDPLGLSDHHTPHQINVHHNPIPHRPRPSSMSGGTIVVKDTKRLVEIANTSKSASSSPAVSSGVSSGGKKEPTLVIIDTNSILSGRGPVPVHNKPSGNLPTSYSVLPMALPAQGVYPANMRATITPIPMKSQQQHNLLQQQQQHHQQQQAALAAAQAQAQANILPSLTDDMYVVEAPSFIVPYVYEKPPIKNLKEFVVHYGKEVEKVKKEADEKKKKKKKNPEDDDDYEVSDDSDDEDSKKENGTSDDNSNDKIDKGADYEELLDAKPITADTKLDKDGNKSTSYFDNPLGKFFFNIGINLVQEFVQTEVLKQQKRKHQREGGSMATSMAIQSLIKNLEFSKEANEPYHMEMKKCDYCSFKTESALALAHHLETPHMRNYVYRCNFCPLEVRSPHDILFHMEAEHNTRGRLERAPSFHQCPNCPYEDNQKGKLSRHMIACAKKFKPEKNLEPPADWEPPAKIPRVSRGRPVALVPGAAPYPTFTQNKNIPILPQRLSTPPNSQVAAAMMRNRGVTIGNLGVGGANRPNIIGKMPIRPGMVYRPNQPGQVLVPTTYQYGGNQIYTVMSGGNVLGLDAETLSFHGNSASIQPLTVRTQEGNNFTIQASSSPSNRSPAIPSKLVNQPSISITPLPRQSSTNNSSSSGANAGHGGGVGAIPAMPMPSVKPGDPAAGKATFVICEICDGYIKDLEQLRNHMQWIHKVKIHPKMIYNRPPLNCQKCQFRFFTDQGLERHLLGSHGLVTSSMQEAANKGKDAGRCPVCGRVYQWKLLNHVARDHKITLKPAHLSYKCTVCTATFGMYKQFENHVYSAHSVVAKRVIEKKNNVSSSSQSSSNTSSSSRNNSDSLLKPLKINDEITIIPQPAKPKPSTSSSSNQRSSDSSKVGLVSILKMKS